MTTIQRPFIDDGIKLMDKRVEFALSVARTVT